MVNPVFNAIVSLSRISNKFLAIFYKKTIQIGYLLIKDYKGDEK